MAGGTVMTLIAPTLQAFFTDRLLQQRQASPQTVASYRDTMRLLLTFVHQQTGKTPAQLDWDHLDATTISAFLNHLEDERHNSTRTRNLRRPLAGPRWRPVHRRLYPRRHQHQGKGPRTHHTRGGQTRPLPPNRQDARVPREPVTMPSHSQPALLNDKHAEPAHRHSRGVGIGRPMRMSA